MGFDTVHYLPLGVNTKRLSKLKVSEADKKSYEAEVSFVGSLYESYMPEILNLVDEYTKGYLEAVMAAQQNLYGYYFFDDVIDTKIVDGINAYIKKKHPDSAFQIQKEALTFAMASEVTRKDRLSLLALLGRRYDTRLYSYQKSEILKGVKCCLPIDYICEMPKVFACSKINLNPVLRCIQSGIPLRALDVMAAGGFLLSAYQQELVEQFAYDEEMVTYDSIPDAIEKTGYYLSRDDLRMQIAKNGQRKVLECYSMQDRLKYMFELAGVI